MNGTLKEGAFSGLGWLKEENNTLTNQTVWLSLFEERSLNKTGNFG